MSREPVRVDRPVCDPALPGTGVDVQPARGELDHQEQADRVPRVLRGTCVVRHCTSVELAWLLGLSTRSVPS